MPKPTIKSLEAQIETLRQLREGDVKQLGEARTQRDHYKLRAEDLERDKAWLKQMHSAVLQSMQEFVKGGRH